MKKVLIAAAAAALALVGVLSLGGAAPAGAAGSCSGKLVELRKMRVDGKKVGELAVYYDGASGRNCARFNHAGWTRGKKLLTRVWIGICSERKAGAKTCHFNRSTDAVDKGRYRYYAGPVTTGASAAGHCISASGYLWIGGVRHAIGTSPWVGHCG